MYRNLALALAIFGSQTAAFPAVMEALENREAKVPSTPHAPDPIKRFNAKQQYISTSGEHAFKMPDLAAGDQRGPCPGLNALANHGYLPRSGVGSTLDFISGTANLGMSTDLSGFLTVLGSTIDGDGTSWSIGGPSKESHTIGGLLGTPQGLSGSHNKYEADNSPGRGDLYMVGDDFTLQMDRYQQLYDMGEANNGEVTLDILTEHRSRLFDESVAKNPYFFNGPFTGVLVQPAAYSFIYRFMSNKSAEHPDGKLTTDVMNSFFGVHKQKDGSLKKIPGSERIPENWYKRAIGDEYSIPFLNTDTALAATKHPKFLNVGGNTGKVNSFTGLDLSDMTGGAFNSKSLLEGNNLACFSSQFATQAAPDAIKCGGVLSNVVGAMSKLNGQLTKSIAGLSCPKLTKPQTTQFNKFPGYKNLNCKTGLYDA